MRSSTPGRQRSSATAAPHAQNMSQQARPRDKSRGRPIRGSISRSRSRSWASRDHSLGEGARGGRRYSRSRTRSRSIVRRRKYSGDRNYSRSRSRSRSPNVPPASKIVVEKLTRNVQEHHLYEIFGYYGPVEDVDLPLNKRFATNRGSACIEYRYPEDAEAAISHMHEAQLDGAVISVSAVAPRRRPSPSPPPTRRTPSPYSNRGPPARNFRRAGRSPSGPSRRLGPDTYRSSHARRWGGPSRGRGGGGAGGARAGGQRGHEGRWRGLGYNERAVEHGGRSFTRSRSPGRGRDSSHDSMSRSRSRSRSITPSLSRRRQARRDSPHSRGRDRGRNGRNGRDGRRRSYSYSSYDSHSRSRTRSRSRSRDRYGRRR